MQVSGLFALTTLNPRLRRPYVVVGSINIVQGARKRWLFTSEAKLPNDHNVITHTFYCQIPFLYST